ncbi:MAG: SHOCT domain-containing protein [Sideroxydans sp.]|nr:SHOCT domain-containing protein [Sideroxydans sp.]
MKKLTVIFLAIFIASCGSVPLTPEAKRVRQIQPDWANACKLISVDEIQSTNGYSPADCQNKAFYVMLNRVAEMGGNAYLVTHESVSPCLTGGTTLTFEVYSCNAFRTESKAPSSGSSPAANDLSKLEALKGMKDRGLINDDEYSRKKREILDKM